MKILVVIATVFVVSQAFPFIDLNTEEWEAYKLTYRKKYESDTEEKFRMKVFMDNRDKIAEHNQRYEMGLVLYKLDINKYADMLDNELVQIFNSYNRTNTTRREEVANMNVGSNMSTVTAVSPYYKLKQKTKLETNNFKNIYRNKRQLFDPVGSITTGIKNIFEITKMEEEKKLIKSQIAINKEKVEVEKQMLKSLEIENKYKEAREKIKVEVEGIMLSKEKELLKSLETDNKYKEKLQLIKLQIEKTKLDQIDEARRSIILQKNRLERKITRLEKELNESENEINILKMEKSEQNTRKIKEIEEKMEKIEENIVKLGVDIINYSRLSFTINEK